MNGYTYTGDGNNSNSPYYWGSTAGKIDANMFSTERFSFSLVSNSLSFGQQVTFSGLASQIEFCPTIVVNVPFTLTLTATPEPGTILLFGLGLASVLAGVIRKRAKTTPAA
jgi:hypothetical protein